MPARPCSSPGCSGLATYRGKCAKHSRQAARARGPRAYDKRRYKIARKYQLTHEPLCSFVLEDGTQCGRLAQHCRHITPLSEGGAPYDLANLMSLCARHHEEIHK